MVLYLGNNKDLRGRVEFEVYGGQVGLSSWLYGLELGREAWVNCLLMLPQDWVLVFKLTGLFFFLCACLQRFPEIENTFFLSD